VFWEIAHQQLFQLQILFKENKTLEITIFMQSINKFLPLTRLLSAKFVVNGQAPAACK